MYVYLCRLDEELTIKVADFGLARDVYIDNIYVIKENDPLPLPAKWLAPEEIFELTFTEKMDVVSFTDIIYTSNLVQIS